MARLVNKHQRLLKENRHRYDELLEQQGGKCAIEGCGRTPSASRKLDLDHDHKTMQIRGLLCWRHNRGLRYFDDRPEILRAAADYLEEVRDEGA